MTLNTPTSSLSVIETRRIISALITQINEEVRTKNGGFRAKRLHLKMRLIVFWLKIFYRQCMFPTQIIPRWMVMLFKVTSMKLLMQGKKIKNRWYGVRWKTVLGSIGRS